MILYATTAALLMAAITAHAAIAPPAPAFDIGFQQRLGETVPPTLLLRGSDGSLVSLRRLLDGQSAILLLDYTACPNLCGTARAALKDALRRLDSAGPADYRVLVVSIDPAEAGDAADRLVASLDSPAAASHWRFLTGDAGNIGVLTHSVGFRYAYDSASGQYMHPAGVVILAPDGVVSRYFLGVDFDPEALRASLAAAARRQVGEVQPSLLLRCLHYDPRIGANSGTAMATVRATGLATLGFLVALVLWRRRRPRSP